MSTSAGSIVGTKLADREQGDPLIERAALKPALRWAFYAFVFSIPFETLNIGVDASISSVSKIVGYILMLFALLQPRECFRRPPAAFWCFVLYLWTYTILGVLQDADYLGPILERLLQIAQMLILFWISSSLMRHDRVIDETFLTLTVSCALLAVLQIVGVTSTAIPMSGRGERISALAANPNTAGAVLSLGLLALIGLTYGQNTRAKKNRLLAWPWFVVMGVPMVLTGSRGAFVALVVGLLALGLSGGSLWCKCRNTLIVLAIGGFLVGASYHSEGTRSRWEKTLREGYMSQRDQIGIASWEMFLERPFFGWGPVHHSAELGSRMGEQTLDTHNLYLWVLTETGLVGTVPYFLGLLLCLRGAWRARWSAHGVLPFAMMLAVLVINMSGTWHNHKLHWLVLACALASGRYFRAALLRNPLGPPAATRNTFCAAVRS